MNFNPSPFVSPDWVETQWTDDDLADSLGISQPLYSPYINEYGNALVPRFQAPLYPTPFNGGIISSFQDAQPGYHTPAGKDNPIPNPPTSGMPCPNHLDNTLKNRPMSIESEDEKPNSIVSQNFKQAPETPPPTPNTSYYKPAWNVPQKVRKPDYSDSSTPSIKRQKRTKPSLNIPSNPPGRRSQSKPAFSTHHAQQNISSSSSTSSNSNFEASNSNTKKSHNLTEKKYRNRLNGYFDTLLAAIPKTFEGADGGRIRVNIPEKKICKGEVLMLALERIKTLEKQRKLLEEENRTLSRNVERLKGIWKDASEV